MKKTRMIIGLFILLFLIGVILLVVYYIQRNDMSTMDRAIEKRFSNEVINDCEKMGKIEYCPAALEKHKKEVEHALANGKSYEEFLKDDKDRRKNLGIKYEVRNVELSTIYEVDDPQVFKDGWNINGIEEAHMVCVHYQIREKYDFNPEKYDKKYYDCVDYVEENNGVWSEWRDFDEWYEAYKVDGKWYCIYADE